LDAVPFVSNTPAAQDTKNSTLLSKAGNAATGVAAGSQTVVSAVTGDIGAVKSVGKVGGAVAVVVNVAAEAKRVEGEVKQGKPAGQAVAGAAGRLGASTGASWAGGMFGAGLMSILGGSPTDVIAGGALGGYFAGDAADRSGVTEGAGKAAETMESTAVQTHQNTYEPGVPAYR
jgi:hypothetical protein